jgi:hypothetical protein
LSASAIADCWIKFQPTEFALLGNFFATVTSTGIIVVGEVWTLCFAFFDFIQLAVTSTLLGIEVQSLKLAYLAHLWLAKTFAKVKVEVIVPSSCFAIFYSFLFARTVTCFWVDVEFFQLTFRDNIRVTFA